MAESEPPRGQVAPLEDSWRLRADQSKAPDPPIAGVGAGGALATVAIWAIGEAGVVMPPEVAAAATLVVCTIIGWLAPRRWISDRDAARQLMQHLRDSGAFRKRAVPPGQQPQEWSQGGRRSEQSGQVSAGELINRVRQQPPPPRPLRRTEEQPEWWRQD